MSRTRKMVERSKSFPFHCIFFHFSFFSTNIIEEREKQKQSFEIFEFIISLHIKKERKKRIKRNKTEMEKLGSGGGSGDSSLRWWWRWTESDLDLVVNALEQEFPWECHYFALLGSSQSPNQSFEDVGTSIVIEQHSKRHLKNPTHNNKEPKPNPLNIFLNHSKHSQGERELTIL